MTDTKINVETLDIALAPWRVEGENDELIYPVPGSWTLAPGKLAQQGIKGLVSCPRCHKAALIPHYMGQVTHGVNELKGFSCKQCGFLAHLRLLHWDTRKLFCIAYESVAADGTASLGKEYTHAETRNEAFMYFVESHKHAGRFRVIDVGVVIGYFGIEADKDQTQLTV